LDWLLTTTLIVMLVFTMWMGINVVRNTQAVRTVVELYARGCVCPTVTPR
jgi:hypothetical protein